MRNRASEYDLDNNLDHVKMMLDDWKSGLPKIALVNKYGITEHAYKVFNKECKDRGYTRVGSTKGSLVSMLDKLKVRDRSASPVRDLRQEYYDKYGTDTEDEKKVEPDKKRDKNDKKKKVHTSESESEDDFPEPEPEPVKVKRKYVRKKKI